MRKLISVETNTLNNQLSVRKNQDISNILLSSIDGNVKFVHSQYSCILTSQVSTCVRQNHKIINNSDNKMLILQ